MKSEGRERLRMVEKIKMAAEHHGPVKNEKTQTILRYNLANAITIFSVQM